MSTDASLPGVRGPSATAASGGHVPRPCNMLSHSRSQESVWAIPVLPKFFLSEFLCKEVQSSLHISMNPKMIFNSEPLDPEIMKPTPRWPNAVNESCTIRGPVILRLLQDGLTQDDDGVRTCLCKNWGKYRGLNNSGRVLVYSTITISRGNPLQ